MKNLIFLKKIVSRFLVNEWTGNFLIRFYGRTIPFRGTKISVPENVSAAICAMLYTRTYESAEIRFVHKYLNATLDVIEIGSSLGGVSCQIGKKLNDKRQLICVEANSLLIPTLRHNLAINKINAQVLNKAIGQGENIKFTSSDSNLTGHQSNSEPNDRQILEVSTITLDSLIKDHGLEAVNLVCDIEGAEVVILKENQTALTHVETMIIELHQTMYNSVPYSIPDLVQLVESLGFYTLDSYGNVYVFKRTS